VLSQTEEIRGKADALHLGFMAVDVARQDAKADLLGFLKSRGLLENEVRPMLEPETRHGARTMHMCPWHTCANTKH
jgi:hypothetical protein